MNMSAGDSQVATPTLNNLLRMPSANGQPQQQQHPPQAYHGQPQQSAPTPEQLKAQQQAQMKGAMPPPPHHAQYAQYPQIGMPYPPHSAPHPGQLQGYPPYGQPVMSMNGPSCSPSPSVSTATSRFNSEPIMTANSGEALVNGDSAGPPGAPPANKSIMQLNNSDQRPSTSSPAAHTPGHPSPAPSPAVHYPAHSAPHHPQPPSSSGAPVMYTQADPNTNGAVHYNYYAHPQHPGMPPQYGQPMPPRPGMPPAGYPPVGPPPPHQMPPQPMMHPSQQPHPGYPQQPGPPPPGHYGMPPQVNGQPMSPWQQAQQPQQYGTPPRRPPMPTSNGPDRNGSLSKDASQPSTPGAASPGGQSDSCDQSSPSWAAQQQRAPSGGGVAPPSRSSSNATPSNSAQSGQPRETQAQIIDRLTGSVFLPQEHYNMRRGFYEHLVRLLESKGTSLTAQPSVSKQVIDLYRLYCTVRDRGGFEAVTKQKTWKDLPPLVNPELTVSSAAGYQLRKHYTAYLLAVECQETGADMNALVEMSESQKKVRKNRNRKTKAEKEAEAAAVAAGGGGSGGTPGPPIGTPDMMDPNAPGQVGFNNEGAGCSWQQQQGQPGGPPTSFNMPHHPHQRPPHWMGGPQQTPPPGAYPPGSRHMAPPMNGDPSVSSADPNNPYYRSGWPAPNSSGQPRHAVPSTSSPYHPSRKGSTVAWSSQGGMRVPQPGQGYPGAPGGHPSAAVGHYGRRMDGMSAMFPPGCVESASISTRKRRKIRASHVGKVDAWRLVMALKSGLHADAHWAINLLNILLYDDSVIPYFNLRNLPGLLEVLVDHLRRCLMELFPDAGFEELEFPDNVIEASTADTTCRMSLSRNGTSTLAELERLIEADECSSDAKLDALTNKLANGGLPTCRSVVKTEFAKTKNTNYTLVTRTGRRVTIESRKESAEKGRLPEMPNSSSDMDTSETDCVAGLLGEFWAKGGSMSTTHLANKSTLAAHRPFTNYDLSDPEPEKLEDALQRVEDDDDDDDCPFFYRAPSKKMKRELASDEVKELTTDWMQDVCDEHECNVINKCLAVSNILRGLSYVPHNDAIMCKQASLIAILGRLLRLRHTHVEKPLHDEDQQNDVTSTTEVDAAVTSSTTSTKTTTSNRQPTPGNYLQHSEAAASSGVSAHPKPTGSAALQRCAEQLREDAFVQICNLSCVMDFYAHESSVSYVVMDGLIHWAVCRAPCARDPLAPGLLSPLQYTLEALCKLSVIERNVDILLATGPWPRLERLFSVLGDLLSMAEEITIREFSIVLTHAICMASTAACSYMADNTKTVDHLVAFLEIHDSNMHQVYQKNGMQALRDNPDRCGTTVGMLRRAASVLHSLARMSSCRQQFTKHQQRLLNFTMSQLMDSRVAAVVADTLFELHKEEAKELKAKEKERETSDANSSTSSSVKDVSRKNSAVVNGEVVDVKKEEENSNKEETGSNKENSGDRGKTDRPKEEPMDVGEGETVKT